MFIHIHIFTGVNAYTDMLMLRIDLTPRDTKLTFPMKRLQFLILLALAMPTNKSKGRSFDKMLLFLFRSVNDQGQIYNVLRRKRIGLI